MEVRRRQLIALAPLLLLFLFPVLAAGCGEVTAAALVRDSIDSMQEVTTARLRAVHSSGGTERVQEIQQQLDGKTWKMKVTEDGTDVSYCIGPDTYVQTGGRWVRFANPGFGTVAGTTIGMGSYEDLASQLEHAKNLRVAGESARSYRVAYTLDGEYFQERLEEQGAAIPSSGAKALAAMRVDVTVTMDRKTRRITGRTFETRGGPGSAPVSRTTITLVSYDDPVDISLPAEAYRCEELDAADALRQ